MPGARTDLPSLTSLRAFAALAVFAFHLDVFVTWVPREFYLRFGYVGVEFFFVLSGFVLSWSTRPGGSRSEFYRRRFARVYPLHALTTVLALLLATGVAAPHSVTNLAANLFLVQAWVPGGHGIESLNPVTWSLSCEAFFYAVTPFLLVALDRASRRTAVIGCSAWVLAGWSGALAWGLSSAQGDSDAFLDPLVRSGGFVLGVLLARLVREGWRPPVPLGGAVLLVCAAGGGLSLSGALLPFAVLDVVLAPCFAVLIVAAALADLRDRTSPLHRLLQKRRLVYAGQLSFAFYLVHVLVIVNLADLGGHTVRGVAGVGLAVAALAVTALLSVVLHEAVEKPAQRLLLRRWSAQRPAASGAGRSTR